MIRIDIHISVYRYKPITRYYTYYLVPPSPPTSTHPSCRKIDTALLNLKRPTAKIGLLLQSVNQKPNPPPKKQQRQQQLRHTWIQHPPSLQQLRPKLAVAAMVMTWKKPNISRRSPVTPSASHDAKRNSPKRNSRKSAIWTFPSSRRSSEAVVYTTQHM